ncbi:ATP-binding protein [Candidatus Pristimantibacillus sp. PTI5]|uniref:ATP-binding protein n=1 Tax=Candidatus Pristimantibacillus sp. PTI5 TaxID=3400422 RepID=UPI003B02D048
MKELPLQLLLHLHKILCNHHRAVAVLDLQGRLLAVNKKFEELHRWKHEEIVGEIIPMIPEESREGIFQMLQRIVHGEEISGIEISMLRKNGSSFFANVSVFPLKNEMGEIIAFVGKLAAGIAHEIRNPLTAIKGFMQLLKERNTNYVDIMLVEIERINNIVNEFMSLAKPHNINFVRINLNKLIEDVVLFMRPQAHLHGVAMIVDFTVDINEFKCEPNQLKQLFINIIKNAIEAMPNGGVVTLFVNRDGDGNVSIKVTDEGQGIPEDGLARLGEPFYSGKENGTGLGIVICHRIVEAHKGTLSFKSKLQQGTTVEINFPND